jgi:hypothetical protein
MRLPPPPQPGEVEMHSDNPNLGARYAKIGEDRAPGLERGEVDELLVEHLHALLHEERIAMPAEAGGTRLERHRLIIAQLLDHLKRQGAGPAAEAPVRLLQGDHVRADLVQHLDRALGLAAAIGAHRLVHVVACNQDHCRRS